MDLEIRQDEAFQRREWRFERIGWGVLTLFVLAGLLGLLGKGPLSWATASAGDVVAVEHSSITRVEADDSVVLTFGPEAVAGDTVTVQLVGSWATDVDLRSISPQPSEESLVPGGRVLEFAVDTIGEDLAVLIMFRAQGIGVYAADVTVADRTASFRQLVLP